MSNDDQPERIEVTFADGSVGYLPGDGTERWAPFGSDEYFAQLVGDDPQAHDVMRGALDLYRRAVSDPSWTVEDR